MKMFHVQYNIGKAKYVVNYHDGIKIYSDGSPVFDVSIFKNKKDLFKFIAKLHNEGYKER